MQLTDVFPKIPQVKRLLVTNPNAPVQTVDFGIWFRALQAFANREEPHLYVSAVDTQKHWLDYYVERFDMPVEEEHDVDAIIEGYKHLVDGYILFDNEDVIQTQNLAATQGGLENLLPIAPDQVDWMERHGIPMRHDLRGRFADDWDAAEWAIDNLWPHTNKKIYANFCIHRPVGYAMGTPLLDFIMYHRGMSLDLPRTRPMRRSLNLYHKMMETSDGPGVQMAWHCAWEQEKEYVISAARYGYYVLCSTSSANMTIHGGVGDESKAYEQPLPAKESCRAEQGKVYVCFYNSDGDATWAMDTLHSKNWLAPQRGRYKFGWGFLPLTVRLMPAMLQYFHETKTDNDCFWGPSSGAAYTYTHAWPDDMVDMYLDETRQLLTQTGQNGCNMVNWHLQDHWREVEDVDAVNREREVLGSEAPGLVCGLGGNPWSRNYVGAGEEPGARRIPKLHSMHIAAVGRDNYGDLAKFAEECPTRPLFCFLFAQISPGIWDQLESEIVKFEDHPELEVLGMDEFFLTLQDAIDRGLVSDELYEKTEELAETWLKRPGRNRLPLTESLCDELVHILHSPVAERRKAIADAAWTQLVSGEVETANNREHFLTYFEGRKPPSDEEEDDTMFYVVMTVAWHLARNAIEAKGLYGNHRVQTINDFRDTCGDIVDVTPFEKLFAAWEVWEEMGAPSLATTTEWMEGVLAAAHVLREKLGPAEGEAFTAWPPKSI